MKAALYWFQAVCDSVWVRPLVPGISRSFSTTSYTASTAARAAALPSKAFGSRLSMAFIASRPPFLAIRSMMTTLM